MISQTAEYALRAILCLASRHGTPLTTQQIAETTQVPAGYLAKVLQALGRAGLVQSQRGLHGGSSLTRPPNQITVLEVVSAVDPLKRIHHCPLGIASHGTNLCPLHRRLDDAVALVEEAFAAHSILDLINEPSSSRPMNLEPCGCAGPMAAKS